MLGVALLPLPVPVNLVVNLPTCRLAGWLAGWLSDGMRCDNRRVDIDKTKIVKKERVETGWLEQAGR